MYVLEPFVEIFDGLWGEVRKNMKVTESNGLVNLESIYLSYWTI